ncbi:MAG: cytochrome c [Planctomycetales bacterium]|nr:cytochrome c [Planctomycetales bacterium]
MALLPLGTLCADQPKETAAARGYRWLTEKPYLPADLDEAMFVELWRQWPEADLRAQAAELKGPALRRLLFSYYGLTARPGDESGKPLQYVVDDQGRWFMNCFACHGGQVAGQVVPGAPNSNYALASLVEDVRMAKLLAGKPLGHMELGSLAMPLGRTNGTTNAVMFGVALLAQREPDLTVKPLTRPPPMVHHDMDAPPWWHFKKRDMIYIDGFAPKGARPLMQFMLVRENGPEKFHAWEDDFRDVYAYLESIEAPRWPYAIDAALAAKGRRIFERRCAECHGTYDDDPARETYPNRLVPIDRVATDRVRLNSLSVEHRERYAQSWFADFGERKTRTDPGGYVAPPLDGVWASAPYLHNGSVPTLWHLLHADERPKIWQRTADGYDPARVGLEIQTFDQLPADVDTDRAARRYFDTRRFGKSAAGHEFPESLAEPEKQALLEYLKTL